MKEDVWAEISEDEVDSVAEEDELECDEEVFAVGKAHRLGPTDEETPGEKLEDDCDNGDDEIGEMSESAQM